MEKRKMIMTGIIIAVLAAACVFAYRMIEQRIRGSIMDGPGMINEGTGMPEEVQGLWISEHAPQWSLRVSKDSIEMDHYGAPVCSVPVHNYKGFGKDGSLPQMEAETTVFAWPYSGADTATVTEASVSRNRISLLVETSDGKRQMLWFVPAAEGTAVRTERDCLPEGVTLKGMKFHQTGSLDSVYFSIRETDEGFEVRMSYDELYWTDMDGYDGEDDGHSRISRVIVSEEEIHDLMDRLMEYDVLSWDGFDRSESLDEGILDGDSGFELKILLSDGRKISARGYNAFPPNSNQIMGILTQFFYSHEDYSAYYPDVFPDSAPSMVEILCPEYTKNSEEYFRIEFYSNGRWAFSFQDPQGVFLEKGTQISEYGDAQDLPLSKYVSLLKEYGFEAYNQTDCREGKTNRYLSITLMFEDEKSYTYRSNVLPENYDAFRAVLVPMMYADYLELKDRQ